MHLAQLNAHSSATADPQDQEITHPWRLQIIILSHQSQTYFVPSTESYFPQVFVLQWHIAQVAHCYNHVVSNDTKIIQYLWRKGIGKGSISFSSGKLQASCGNSACYNCWWHKLFKKPRSVCSAHGFQQTPSKGPARLHVWLYHTLAQQEILSLYSWVGAHRPC